MLEALIFDVDGTLAETEEIHRRAFNEIFAEQGLAWHWDRTLYGRLLDVTGGKERIRHFLDTHAIAPAPDAAAIAALHQGKTRRYVDLVARGELALRPGIARLIDEARRAGVKLAIATTTSLPNIESLLLATLGPDAIGWFDAIAAGDEVEAKKPAPDVYLLALERLGLPATRCLAFEDSRNGVVSAMAAGLATVVTVSHYTAQQDFPEALSVLDHLGEPDEPCRRLAGRAPHGAFVDMATLREWVGA